MSGHFLFSKNKSILFLQFVAVLICTEEKRHNSSKIQNWIYQIVLEAKREREEISKNNQMLVSWFIILKNNLINPLSRFEVPTKRKNWRKVNKNHFL